MFVKQTKIGDFEWGRPASLPTVKYEVDDQIDIEMLADDILGEMKERLFDSYKAFVEAVKAATEQVWPNYGNYIPLFQSEDFDREVLKVLQQKADIQWVSG
jgi:hypothetical protein